MPPSPQRRIGKGGTKGRNESILSPSKILGFLVIVFTVIINTINIAASRALHNDEANDDTLVNGRGQFQNPGGHPKLQPEPQPEQPNLRKNNVNGEIEKKHNLGGLSCDSFGGPSGEVASEMVYWSDIESDSGYQSPFYDESSIKYITFEPDHGGWNNIRMAMETVLVMAHAMGRTLVLPPNKGMYLLGKGGDEHKKEFSFNDFFHLDSIAVEHEGLDIITMEEFLKRMAMKGKLKDRTTGEIRLPPNKKVDWNGKDLHELWQYLLGVSYQAKNWDPGTCVAAFPSAPGQEAVDELLQTKFEVLKKKLPDPLIDYKGDPTAVDGPVLERLREMMATRKELCIYDTNMQSEPLIHFAVGKNTRLLSHFYAFIFFQDWKQDLWSKRFVRDHVRYIDEMMCAAARIVAAVRERAAANSPNQSTDYDSFHIRRGDFQYKNTRITADQIYEKSKDQLTEGTTLYIATDERDKSFFSPLQGHYNLTFLDDYMHLIEGVNPNYYGMLDQLVAYRGSKFFGTWFSTLSGFVNRMRGYASVKQKWPGHERGSLPSFYFFPDEKKFQMDQYMAVKLPIYMREFPVSWRDIDRGIGKLD